MTASPTLCLRAVPALATAFAAVALVSASLVHPLDVQAPAKPPSILDGPAVYKTLYRSPDRLLVSGVTWDLAGRKVLIRSLQLVPGGPDIKSTAKFPVRYWPTCASRVADSTLCVAGKSPRTGNTIVEVWTVTTPTVSAAGPSTVELNSVEEVYNASASGREDIKQILPHFGPNGFDHTVLLWFEQSREVWSLNLETSACTRIASPATVVGQTWLSAPYLADATRGWSGVESGAGYVYVFDKRAGDLPMEASQPSVLVLRDSARDGVIESATLYAASDLISAGWNQSAHWVAW